VQTFEHWIVKPDAHARAYWRQRRAAVRDRDERATGLIDLGAPAAATNLSDGVAERIRERMEAVYGLCGRMPQRVPGRREAVTP
jgi:myo-inositol catabolism protein IolC